jgi:hypothetical protein
MPTDRVIGTEHLRWMGDARFMYGFVRGRECLIPAFVVDGLIDPVVNSNATPIEVELKVSSDDKHHLVNMSKDNGGVSHHVKPVDHDNWDEEPHLPPLLHTGPAHHGETEGWVKFEGDILYG